jgi:hypothetical protein
LIVVLFDRRSNPVKGVSLIPLSLILVLDHVNHSQVTILQPLAAAIATTGNETATNTPTKKVDKVDYCL